jgi:adenylate kinase
MKLVMLGPPGAGKGTFSGRLQNELRLKHISSGDILRNEIKKKTAIGRKIEKIIDAGNLVHDDIIIKIMQKRLQGKDKYILDGFPRTLGQARAAEEMGIDKVVFLKVAQKVIMQRMSGRRLDPVTGKIYHLKNIPPPKKIISRLVQRNDDKPQVVRSRLKIYRKLTQPIVKYYRKKNVLITVDAAQKPEKVFQEIKRALRGKI